MEKYGNYCLTFSAPWTGAPSLSLLDTQAKCWYQRVIYDEKLQRNAIERALKAVVLEIELNTAGHNEGPWAESMVNSCAMNTAQLLLCLAVGFKRKSFERENEWRIVCAPRLGTNNSAPKSIDDNFKVNIKPLPRRHVALQIRRELILFQPLLIRPVPFLHCARNPSRCDLKELSSINNILRDNMRSDLHCS